MIDLPLIHTAVCQFFNIEKMDLFKKSRKTDIVYRRQLFYYLSRSLTNQRQITFEKIGNYYADVAGKKDHATVLYSCRKIEDYLSYDKQVRKDIEQLVYLITIEAEAIRLKELQAETVSV